MKTCSKCNIEKPFEAFHRNKNTYDGYQSSCIECYKLRRLELKKNTLMQLEKEITSSIRLENKLLKRENKRLCGGCKEVFLIDDLVGGVMCKDCNTKKYSEYNKKEKRRKYIKEYNEKNKEKYKDYGEENKEKIKEYQMNYYEKNKEKVRDYMREYYIKNKEKASEYRLKNKEKSREYNKRYYEKKKLEKGKNNEQI